jgi:hypothetical protein
METSPRPVPWVALWVPLLAWMMVIYVGSSIPAGNLPGLFAVPGADKVAHLAEYGVLGFLAARAMGRMTLEGTALLTVLAATFALAYGLTDEVHQLFVPNRSFSIHDLAADVIGASIGAFIWVRGLRWRNLRWLW